MSEPKSLAVFSKDGARGEIAGGQPPDGQEVLVQFDTGQQVVVPADILVAQAGGAYYYLPIRLDDLGRTGAPREERHTLEPGQPLVLPVVAEQVEVQKRTVETGRVRVRKLVTERDEVVDEPLLREEVDVEHVPVNRVVKTPPRVRQDGDTTVIPIVEEVLVVEKRLMLREELRVTKRRTTVRKPQQVTLRREEVTVERTPAEGRTAEAETH